MTEDSANQTTLGHDVFVSYASQDAAVANAIVENLEGQGLKCWMAPRDVKAGSQYADAIVRAINDANALVLVMSGSAVASSHVAREVERAASKRKPIIPFRIDAASLNPELEYFLSNSQWIDVPKLGMPAALARLKEAVGHGWASSPHAVPNRRAVGVGKRVAVAAAVFVAVGVVVVVGWHSWSSSHNAAQPATVAMVDRSIAVLPFVDMSEKKDQEYFADGLSEELIDMLTKVPNLRVPARTSSFYFKGKSEDIPTIARRLMVAHVLEGSVRKSGDHLRITAQLVQADNGYHLWSETFDRELDDIFKVQDEISSAVVSALRLKLMHAPNSQDRRTSSTDAYNQYLLGQQFMRRSNRDDNRRAMLAFQKAVDLDPAYSSAWAGYASAAQLLADSAESAAAVTTNQEQARAAADKAIMLRPDLDDGYVARAWIRAGVQQDYAGATVDLQRALALAPENTIALFSYATVVLRPTGRLDEAAAALRKAVANDPLNAPAWSALGSTLYMLGNFSAAREALNRSLEISPEQGSTPAYIAYSWLLEGHPADALASSQRSSSELFRLAGGALAHHDLGHAKESQQLLEELIAKYAHNAAYQIAEVYAWRGDKDRAFEWLERAREQHDLGLITLKVNPLLRDVKGDPRYKAFLKKMNLPE